MSDRLGRSGSAQATPTPTQTSCVHTARAASFACCLVSHPPPSALLDSGGWGWWGEERVPDMPQCQTEQPAFAATALGNVQSTKKRHTQCGTCWRCMCIATRGRRDHCVRVRVRVCMRVCARVISRSKPRILRSAECDSSFMGVCLAHMSSNSRWQCVHYCVPLFSGTGTP